MTDFDLIKELIPKELGNTIYMVFVSTLISFLLGLPLGILLFQTARGFFYQTLGILVNMGRSLPFAILMIALIPVTRFVVGTSLGTTAAIVPLAIAGIPFMARLVEMALRDVDKELIESATVMRASPFQIISKVLLPEAWPAILNGVTITCVNLIGYSAMAGLVGGGGLGKIAIQYGYQRFNAPLMLITLVILLLLVECVQFSGNRIVNRILLKRGKI